MTDQNTVEFEVADIAAPENPRSDHDAAPDAAPTEGLGFGTEHAEAGHGAKQGLPQLDTSTFASQIFWLIITFSFLYWVMSRIALPRLQGVILDRKNKIKGDLDEAAAAKRASEAALANYDKALGDARAKAVKMSDELRNKVQAEANAKSEATSKQLAADTQKAEARIAEMRTGAMSRLAVIARDTVAEIVEKLTGEIANAGDIDAALNTALKRS